MTQPAQGDIAPDFSLDSDTAGRITLSALRGKRVVLYFYPKDNTPGCTMQACEFRDLNADFAARDALVFGISRDSLARHAGFRDKYTLSFPLLSDPDHAVHELYGAWGMKKLYGKESEGAIRTTVVIDEEGRILHYARGVKAKGNAERTLALLGA